MTPHEASRCAVREGDISPGHWAGGTGLGGQGPLVSEMALLGRWWPGPGCGGCLPGAWALGTVAGAGAGSGRLCTERERRSACRAPGPLPENDVKDFRPVVTLPVTGSVG